MIIKKCPRCGKTIDKEVSEDEKMFLCPNHRCGVWVANRHYKGREK